MANERNELILKTITITADMAQERLGFIEAQAEADLAERPPWDDGRIARTIRSDVQDLISLDEQSYALGKKNELIYPMIPLIINELRTSKPIQAYLREKKAIELIKKNVDEKQLNRNGSEYRALYKDINARLKNNSLLLQDVVTMNSDLILASMTSAQKNQYGLACRDAEKQRVMNQLLNAECKTGDTPYLVLNTDISAETAKIWGDLNTPVASRLHIDLLGALFHAAVSLNSELSPPPPPATKGFIYNRTYWLGIQPYITVNDGIITNIKRGINSGLLNTNDEILNGHIDSLSGRLLNSLREVKSAFEGNQIDSALFLVLSIQSDADGLKTGAHYVCFQITRDPTHRNAYILHEANSTETVPVSKPATEIANIANNGAMQYVLAKAKDAGYNVSTLKAKTVYHQATNVGCGICAIQTAIDSITSGENISNLQYHEGSEPSKTYPGTLEIELRLHQMAILFNSPDRDVQYKLMTGSASQSIHLDGGTLEKQPAPSGTMLADYLPPTIRSSSHAINSSLQPLERGVSSLQSRKLDHKRVKTAFDLENFQTVVNASNQNQINTFVQQALEKSTQDTLHNDIAAMEMKLNQSPSHSVGLKIQLIKALSTLSPVIEAYNVHFLANLDMKKHHDVFNAICSKLSCFELLVEDVREFKEKGDMFFKNVSGLPMKSNEEYQTLVSTFESQSKAFITLIEAKQNRIPFSVWNDSVKPALMALIGCLGMIGRAIYYLFDAKGLSPYENYQNKFFKSERTQMIEHVSLAKTDTERLIEHVKAGLQQPKK
ncbi:MAG: hypothetical protein Q8R24_03970 [Legionellaceae bacterium]|nr:hypothetical protein [Legionellaceae bacterium]